MEEFTVKNSLSPQAIDMINAVQAKPFHNYALRLYDFRLELFEDTESDEVMTLSFIVKGHGENKTMHYMLNFNDHPEGIDDQPLYLDELYDDDDVNLGFIVSWFTKFYTAFDLTDRCILNARNFFIQTLPLAKII